MTAKIWCLSLLTAPAFCLPIDANLRTSITKARRIQPARGLGANGHLRSARYSDPFPSGASVEEIAEESGWEPERVRRYEWPIVAERATLFVPLRA